MQRRKAKSSSLLAGLLMLSLILSPCQSAAAPNGIAVLQAEPESAGEHADFEAMRMKWKVLLTGGEELDPSVSLVRDYAGYVDELAGEHWNTMIKLGEAETDARSCLFPDLPLTDKSTRTGSSQITMTFDRLKAITLAYETKGSFYYQDPDVKREMIAALDMMTENHYSLYYATSGTGTSVGGGTKSFGNWYDWRIGTPRQLCDLLLMFSDSLTEEQMSRYVAPIMKNNQRVDTTGANRTWIANIFIQCGVLLGDEALVTAGRTGVKDVFKYVNSGDGFHRDGSFIQHTYYAYNGGYGKALLCTMAPMMYVLNGTDYAIAYDDHCEQIFYDMLFEAYEPLIYGGRFMDMARERELSRVANQDDIPGRQAIRSMIMLVDVLPEDQKARAESMIKEWLSDEEVLAQVCIDPVGGYNEYYLPAGIINKALAIVDSAIPARGNLVLHKRYGAMDRVVHLRDDFGFTVSMSSDRIYNTEGTNDEGLRLWHIGDGLTYLYNQDKTYYSNHYWATVDHQRLPGTTVNRYLSRGAKAGYNTKNPYNFAGGTDLGEFGIAGLEVQGVGSGSRNGAHAKKSWFMFDDEIVALGSDIRSTLDGSSVETIVENRKIALDKSNILTVDGTVQEFTAGGDPYVESNKSIQVKTVTAASGKDVSAMNNLTGLPSGGTVIVECQIKMPVVTDFFALRLYGKGAGDADQKNIVFLTMRDGSMVPRIPNTSNKDAYTDKASLLPDQWHDLKIELDMDNGIYNYYFEGTHIKEGFKTSSNPNNTVNANLENAAFYTVLSGGSNTFTAFEVLAPGSRSGSIQIDNLKISYSGGSIEHDYENIAEDYEVNDLGGWTVVNRDNAAGSGAKVIQESRTVIPEGSDDFTGSHDGIGWIHLAGATDNSDVGYYFPGKADIQGVRETREGTWELVNTYEKFRDSEPRVNSFATFWFDHGIRPNEESYAYVVLPGKSAAETEGYETEPDITILCQDTNIHAVRENTLNMTGINFFAAGRLGAFRMPQAGSVMYREHKDDNIMELSFADPTQSVAELILETGLPILEVLEADEEIAISQNGGMTVFTAKPEGSLRGVAGRSFQVTVKLAEQDNTFETIAEGEIPEHWEVESGAAKVAIAEDDNHVLEVTEGTTVSTNLIYPPHDGGSIISFMVRPVNGKGSIQISSGQGHPVKIDFDETLPATQNPLTAGEWHEIKVKVNEQTRTCQFMVDGELFGDPQSYEGDAPEVFRIITEAGGQIELDNLLVYASSNEAPTRPERLTYTTYSDTSVTLRWDASESDNPLHYIVAQDGMELAGEVKENTYTVTGLAPQTTYAFTVQAADDDYNYSELSEELHVTTLERQQSGYVINFDAYQPGTDAQNRWVYSGDDIAGGRVEIVETPGEKEDESLAGMMTDIDYWNRPEATTSDAAFADLPAAATDSDADMAHHYAGQFFYDLATPSDAQTRNGETDKVIYVLANTVSKSKNAEYTFDKQTEVQTYRLKLYFDESVKYTSFSLLGSNGKQAVTMILNESGIIGYRGGDAPATTRALLSQKVEGKWIDFVITADPKTQTYSISADGVEQTGIQFRYATDDICQLILSAPGGASGGFYADDIVIPLNNDFQKLTLTEIEEDLSEPIAVPFGTAFYDLDLPEYLDIKAVDYMGEEGTVGIKVNWDQSDYDGNKSGTYTLYGTLAYPANCINEIADSKVKIKVKVEKKIDLYKINLVQTTGGTISTDDPEVEAGTEVVVTADPDPGYKITGWLIDGKPVSGSGTTYRFTPKADTEVSAVFEMEDVDPEVKYYTVKAATGITGGTVKVSSAYAKEGTLVTVTVKPDQGYILDVLKVNGAAVTVSSDLTYTFTLRKNTDITASFKIDTGDDDDDGDNPGSSTGSGSRGRYGQSTTTVPAYAVSGSWNAVGGQWTFRTDKGGLLAASWACIRWGNGYEWYYFNQEGYMHTGWLTLAGDTYYLQELSDGNRGRMLTGWQEIDGKWYYFNTVSDGRKGALLKETVTPDGYTVDAAGVWAE